MIPKNMYEDAVKLPFGQLFIGCEWNCNYCKPSFQRQMRRQIHNCEKCGNYIPHWHEERYQKYLKYPNRMPKTEGDQFIWLCRAGDIYFAEEEWINKMINLAKIHPDKTFFFQTKSPDCYYKYKFPDNVILGITMECDVYRSKITEAMPLWHRYVFFKDYQFPRKIVTIEPIMDFKLERFLKWLKDINPMRIYIGYDTKKCDLIEPPLEKTEQLIKELRKFTVVKEKYMK